MIITDIVWTENSVSHIARHGVIPEEVEEVCFSRSRKIEKGLTPFFYVTGQTAAGRYLFVVVKLVRTGQAKVITARDMDRREKLRYRRR